MRLFGGKSDKKETSNPLMVLDDRKNRAELWPNKITIRRHGALNAINVGLVGEKDIYLHTITGIQIKKPGLTTGYIQFMAMGSQDSKRGITGAVQDENTVIFKGKENHRKAMEMKAKIEQLTQQSLPAPTTPVSTADELAKLAELRAQGILSDKEFDEEKQLLLGGRK